MLKKTVFDLPLETGSKTIAGLKLAHCLRRWPYINLYSARIDLKRQILTSKVYPHTVRVKIFIMIVDPYHS